MMTRHTGKAAAVFVAAALISSACSSQDVSSGTTDETPAGQPSTTDSPLTLGYLLPETGIFAFLGPPMVSGVQLAVQAINDAGGVLGSPIQLLSADEGDDADLALAQANRLIASGVQAIIGAATSGITEAIMGDVTKAGVIQCSPSNWSVGLANVEDNGYFFRTTPGNLIQAPVLAELIANEGFQTVSVTARNDDYGLPMMAETIKQLEARGVEVVLSDVFDVETGDFDPLVSAILRSGAEAHVLLTFSEGAQIIQGLLDGGVSPTTLFGSDGIAGSAFSDNFASPDVIEGLRLTAQATPVPEAFEAQLLAFNPNLVDFLFAPNTYDCVNLIALAASTGGSTSPASIRDHMIAVTVGDNACDTFVECIAFINRGETIAYQSATGVPLALTQVRQGGGDPSYGIVEVSTWDGGQLVLTETVIGNFNG